MKNFISLFVLIFLCSCSQNLENKNIVTEEKTARPAGGEKVTQMAEPPAEYTGIYHPGQYKDGADSTLYTFNPYVQHMLDSMYNKLLPNPYPNQTVYLSFKGSPDSLPTNRGTQMDVISINSMGLKNAANCPTPYDYWCSGNEPFWQLEISEKENLIDFYNPMDQTTQHFIYVKPEMKNAVTSYTTVDQSKKNKITIKITNEKCSDGMSEKEYSFKVEVVLNNKTYKGCANTFSKQ